MLALLVEDQADLAELIIDYLESLAIACDYAFDGVNALSLIENNRYDVIILDVSMPRLNGFSVCQKLRASGNNTPVIFLTARDQLVDKLSGFSSGADDYLTKPFELEELVVRIQVLAKRIVPQRPVQLFELNNLVINYTEHSVRRAGRLIELSPTQWQLLILLAEHSPNIVTRSTIEKTIWPEQEPSKDMVKMLVFRLRSLIDSQDESTLVHTVRGAGIALREAI
ncbi:DNA-binding response regulator [Thalassotalea insulae]|uniref:DNA-binding response regulator n=1 Tax=Thalassotalea insulae TaxID=2056778 RepID=A0ABQ6GS91_9GAMM|nr:response regulator transcription factor [Thalassotalea insulae]GLX77001.1 DNA-binding response regulator [Thalassotalea insulae]